MTTIDDAGRRHAAWDPLDPGGVPVTTGRYRAGQLPLLGGDLCLDFTNTAVWRMRATPDETLIAYADLLDWSELAGGITAAEADALRAAAETAPGAASGAVARAVATREALYRIMLAAMADVPPDAAVLTTFNTELRLAMAAAGVRSGRDGLRWDWPPLGQGAAALDLGRPLWPIVRSAADLLTGDGLARVKRCPGDGCGWLFLDTSRNGSRRWCDMAGCGNRARVRAFAARQREGR